MGKTSIEWTEQTWNPTRGCSHASPGCAHCYAERISARFSDPGQPFHLYAERKPKPHFTGKVGLVEEMLDVPLRRRKPTTYFTNSMSDLFHEDLPDEAIDRVFGVMALSPQHRFIVLTKRSKRMRQWFSHPHRTHFMEIHAANLSCDTGVFMNPDTRWPLPNVILGVSCESQEYADQRIPELLATPAACRMVSAEPLLTGLNIRQYLMAGTNPGFCLTCRKGHGFTRCPNYGGVSKVREACGNDAGCDQFQRKHFALDWVICGGESGPGARPFDIAWARSVRDQCKAAGVAYFLKQLGAHLRGDPSEFPTVDWHIENGHGFGLCDRKGGDPSEWPEDMRVRELPALLRTKEGAAT